MPALELVNPQNSHPKSPEKYRLNDVGVNTASFTRLSVPDSKTESVHQYAADYYEVAGSQSVKITFRGDTVVPILGEMPASGNYMWVANRANYSNVRLTREFDLTAVSKAALYYNIFTEIEYSYDFAYLSISTDGGENWEGLVAEGMQGQSFFDDPSNVAYTERFYTGDTINWIQETADLTPYVGNKVLIRFEYITDPILTFGGLAVDNIAIPEIGFFDDTETDSGWIAEGFVRSTGYIPQQWHLQLIQFENNTPTVEHIPLSPENEVQLTINPSNGGAPILVVAAYAPMTLEPATYRLDIR